MIYELVLQNFNCSLESVFSLLLLQPFNLSPVSFACYFQNWGCVILREIDFLLKICWSIPCVHPSWKVHTPTVSVANVAKRIESMGRLVWSHLQTVTEICIGVDVCLRQGFPTFLWPCTLSASNRLAYTPSVFWQINVYYTPKFVTTKYYVMIIINHRYI